MTALEPVLLPAEAAPLLHVSERTLRRMKAERVIRWVQLRPRVWGMRPSDIAAYHDSRADGGDGRVEQRQTKGRPAKGAPRGSNVVSFTAQDRRR